MNPYSPEVETCMRRLFNNLNERDRRHYAAVEAMRLGHGGIQYISQLLVIDPKTIRIGITELKKTSLSANESAEKEADAPQK
ncbi:MAG: hypothetical protein R3B93_20280 [Bacteroidia bacterium]